VQTPRQGANGCDSGQVRHRQREAFTELGRLLKKIRKTKNAGNCLKSEQIQRFLKILKKKNYVKFSNFFWFCALFGQFPAFLDFLKIWKN
jgi:hypothetical protein